MIGVVNLEEQVVSDKEEHGLTLSVRNEFGLNLRSLFAKPAGNELNQGRNAACSVGTIEHEILTKFVCYKT